MSEKELDNVNIDAERLTDRPHKNIRYGKCRYCNNIIGYGSRGMCNKHYMKYKRHGDPLYNNDKPKGMIEGYYRDAKTRRRKHRVIWEEYYREKLTKEEIIHHINFVKTDNRIENLWKYENASEHSRAHEQYKRLLKVLKENEEIYFNEGEYKIRYARTT